MLKYNWRREERQDGFSLPKITSKAARKKQSSSQVERHIASLKYNILKTNQNLEALDQKIGAQGQSFQALSQELRFSGQSLAAREKALAARQDELLLQRVHKALALFSASVAQKKARELGRFRERALIKSGLTRRVCAKRTLAGEKLANAVTDLGRHSCRPETLAPRGANPQRRGKAAPGKRGHSQRAAALRPRPRAPREPHQSDSLAPAAYLSFPGTRVLLEQTRLARVPESELALKAPVLELDAGLDPLHLARELVEGAELSFVARLGGLQLGQEALFFAVEELRTASGVRGQLAGVQLHDARHALQLPHLVHLQLQGLYLLPQGLYFLALAALAECGAHLRPELALLDFLAQESLVLLEALEAPCEFLRLLEDLEALFLVVLDCPADLDELEPPLPPGLRPSFPSRACSLHSILRASVFLCFQQDLRFFPGARRSCLGYRVPRLLGVPAFAPFLGLLLPKLLLPLASQDLFPRRRLPRFTYQPALLLHNPYKQVEAGQGHQGLVRRFAHGFVRRLGPFPRKLGGV